MWNFPIVGRYHLLQRGSCSLKLIVNEKFGCTAGLNFYRFWSFWSHVSESLAFRVGRLFWCDPGEWRYLMKTLLMWLAISDSYGDDARGDGSGEHEGWQGGEHGGGHGDNEELNGRIRIVATVGRFSGMQLCTHWQPHKVGYAVRHQFALTAPI